MKVGITSLDILPFAYTSHFLCDRIVVSFCSVSGKNELFVVQLTC